MPLAFIPIAIGAATGGLTGYGVERFFAGRSAIGEAKEINDKIASDQAALEARLTNAKDRELDVVTRFSELERRASGLRRRGEVLSTATGERVPDARSADGKTEAKFTFSDEKVTGRSPWQKLGRSGVDGFGGLAGGAALRQGAIHAIRCTAKASTGTAIRNLTGAAAQRATMSAAGGGSVAAGGGGIAAGVAALNVLAIGGTVAVLGQRYCKRSQEKLKETLQARREFEEAKRAADAELAAEERALSKLEQELDEAETLALSIEMELGMLEWARSVGLLAAFRSEQQMLNVDIGRLMSMVRT